MIESDVPLRTEASIRMGHQAHGRNRPRLGRQNDERAISGMDIQRRLSVRDILDGFLVIQVSGTLNEVSIEQFLSGAEIRRGHTVRAPRFSSLIGTVQNARREKTIGFIGTPDSLHLTFFECSNGAVNRVR